MATKLWKGGTTDHTTEWDTAANWDPAVVPADGDVVIVPATSIYAIDGIDGTIGGTVQLQGFTVEAGYSGTIGSAAVPLKISLKDGASYYDLNWAGTGRSYIQVADGFSQINVTAAAATSAGKAGLSLTTAHDATTGGVIIVACQSGSQSVAIGTGFSDTDYLDAEAQVVRVAEGTVTLGAALTEGDGSTAPDLQITGGTTYSNCPLGTVTKLGGTYYHENGNVTAFNGVSGTTYERSDDTMTAVELGGTERLIADANGKTRIFTNTILLGGSCALDDAGGSITFSNAAQIKGGANASQLPKRTNATVAFGALP